MYGRTDNCDWPLKICPNRPALPKYASNIYLQHRPPSATPISKVFCTFILLGELWFLDLVGHYDDYDHDGDDDYDDYDDHDDLDILDNLDDLDILDDLDGLDDPDDRIMIKAKEAKIAPKQMKTMMTRDDDVGRTRPEKFKNIQKCPRHIGRESFCSANKL